MPPLAIWSLAPHQHNNLSFRGKEQSIKEGPQTNLSTNDRSSPVASPVKRAQPGFQVLRSIRTSSAFFDKVETIECPAFAESISEGDIRWEKAQGDEVAVDEVICEIETDKTSVPVPSPVGGVLEELLVEDGSTVNPGMALAKIKARNDNPLS